MAKPGPKTESGKAVVRLNAVRHGLRSVTPVIPDLERQEDWERHREGAVASLSPEGYLEMVLAERIALALWRLWRVVRYERESVALEQGYLEYDLRVGRTASSLARRMPTDINRRRGARLLPGTDRLDKIVRYESHLNRQFYQALHELEALQARPRGKEAPLARVDVQGLPEG